MALLPTKAGRAHVKAVMFWPDDIDAQQRLRDAAAADFIEWGTRQPELQVLPAGPESADAWQWVRSIKPLDEEKNNRRFVEGVAVGRLVVDTLLASRVAAGQPVAFGAAKKRAVDFLNKIGGNRSGRSLKSFDNYTWPGLRPAGHLWAAYYALRSQKGVDPFEDGTLLMEMLTLAESLLVEASQVLLPKRHFLLDIEKACRLRPIPPSD